MKRITFSSVILSSVLLGGCATQQIPTVTPPTPTPTDQISPTTTPTLKPTPSTDETETLKAAIKADLVAKHGSSASEFTISVSKNDGKFSSGGITATGGGAMWFGAKVGDNWKLVWDGNGIILCSDLTAYPNFPKSMIPECFDQKTQKLIKR